MKYPSSGRCPGLLVGMAFMSVDWWWSVQIYIYCICIMTLGLYVEYGRFEFERRYICNVDCKLVGEVTMEVIVVTIKFLWFCRLSLAICSAKPLPSYSHIIVQLKAKHLNLHSCYGKQSFLPNLEVYSIASYISYILIRTCIHVHKTHKYVYICIYTCVYYNVSFDRLPILLEHMKYVIVLLLGSPVHLANIMTSTGRRPSLQLFGHREYHHCTILFLHILNSTTTSTVFSQLHYMHSYVVHIK